jgi:tRNA (adenine57-N1/adenine58-N1)-methyltransferase
MDWSPHSSGDPSSPKSQNEMCTQFFSAEFTLPGSLTVGDLPKEFTTVHEPGTIDRVVLDMLAPWECVPAVADCLAPGGNRGRLCGDHHSARAGHRNLCVRTASSPSPLPWETFVREWHVEGLAMRPGHKMNGHTGFLVTATTNGARQPSAPIKKRQTGSWVRMGWTTRGQGPVGLPPSAVDQPVDS